MGGQPPYLYDNRSPYNGFNPRAYTQASYTSLPSVKPKQDGPLINFNKHPDSYMVVSLGPKEAKPVPPGIAKKIIVIRWVQFALRVPQLVGALGLLACVIMLKGTVGAASWIMKIAPAWDAFVTAYAVYHLLRHAKGRTPASSASYHFFALFNDIGLLPFYVVISMSAATNMLEVNGASGRWRSMLSTNSDTDTIILSVLIVAATVGGLHVFSVFLDSWLVYLFRKISNLPPDMNPFEENLTSRYTKGHKHKSSELSGTTMASEKYTMSGSTINLFDPAQMATVPDPNARRIPFAHSRMNSDTTYSPHTLDSAHQSRTNLNGRDSLYQQPTSERTSRIDVQRPASSRPSSRPASRYQQNAQAANLERITSPASFVSARSEAQSRYSTPQPSSQSEKNGLLNDNWYVMDDGTPSRGHTPAPRYEERPHDELAFRHQKQESLDLLPGPLSSHPPTLPEQHPGWIANRQAPEQQIDHNDKENQEDIGRALTMGSSVYSDAESIKSSSTTTPKSRYYGDLSAATMGIRNGGQQSPTRAQHQRSNDGVPGAMRPMQEQQVNGRVVSRTGVDIDGDNVMYMPEERRQASGRDIQEARGWYGVRKREVSGIA